MKYYSVINKNETLPLMTTWVDHEVIVVNEISHTKKDKCCDSTYMRYLEQIVSQTQEVEWWLPGGGGGEMESQCLMGTEFFKMRRTLWMDGSDGCTTV